ncbi:MAG: DNA-directed RNA polymerase subunit alpha [Candidatus Paceibacterota bacterium]
MIPLPTSIKSKKVSDNSVIFEIESLYPGYGVTIGNALRRVLLSSLNGAAVTEVKIKNAPHEFATMEGVKEDVLHILMNLKQLRFKMYGEEPQTATLIKKGEGKVTGKDFAKNPELMLANPESHIATITDKNIELEIELKIEKGTGYRFHDIEKEKKDIGVIGLDAIFTPIKKVNYTVENMRVGKRTDFDKVILEVETDGTITPEEALAESLKILIEHFSFLHKDLGFEEKQEKEKEADLAEDGEEKPKKAKKTAAKKKAK